MPRFASYLLLLLPMAVGVIVLLAARGRRRPANADYVCGKCGYDVRGLPGQICPECGSDLAVVGIRRPGDREPLGAPWRLITWTVFVFLSVFLPFAALWNEVERQWLMVYDISHYKSFTAPRSQAYQEIRFDYRARSLGNNAPSRPPPAPQRLKLTVTLKGGAVRTMDLTTTGSPQPDFAYHYLDSTGRTVENPGGLSEDVLAAWMTDAGVAAGSPEIRRELAAIIDELRTTVSQPSAAASVIVTSSGPFSGGGSGGSSAVYPARSSNYVAWAAPLLTWAVGVPFMLRRRK